MKRLFFLPLIALAISSCSTLKVTYDVDSSADFSKFKTFEYFGWSDDSDKILNQLDKNRIESAFNDEFKKRDIKYVKEDGDLVVVLFIVVQQKTQTTATTTNYGYFGGYYGYGPGWGWGGPGMGHSTTTYSDYDYQVGTLVIDVFDKSAEKLVWEGIGKKTLDDNPQTRDKNIQKAVAAIMKNFPVKPLETE